MLKDSPEEMSDCRVRGFIDKAKKSEAARHFRNARKEMLLAIKSIVEAGIERIDREEESASDAPARKVEIQ